MDIDKLKNEIEKIKEYSPELYHDIINVTFPFYMFHQKLTNKLDKILEENHQLNQSELDVMCCVKSSKDKNYTLSPTKIYERLLFTTGGITKVLKKLEEKKFIIRLDNQYDKRSKLVQLTDSGLNKCDEALKDVLDHDINSFSPLSNEEKELFQKLSEKLLKSI